eukprot:XP_011428203.1 PREDICTED: uncharacterized protein LOC105328865 [Crassostrea gigas]
MSNYAGDMTPILLAVLCRRGERCRAPVSWCLIPYAVCSSDSLQSTASAPKLNLSNCIQHVFGLCVRLSASIGELAGSTSICSCLLPSFSYVETIGMILYEKNNDVHL